MCSGKAALSLEEVRGLWNILIRAGDTTRVVNRHSFDEVLVEVDSEVGGGEELETQR